MKKMTTAEALESLFTRLNGIQDDLESLVHDGSLPAREVTEALTPLYALRDALHKLDGLARD